MADLNEVHMFNNFAQLYVERVGVDIVSLRFDEDDADWWFNVEDLRELAAYVTDLADKLEADNANTTNTNGALVDIDAG